VNILLYILGLLQFLAQITAVPDYFIHLYLLLLFWGCSTEYFFQISLEHLFILVLEVYISFGSLLCL